MRDYTPTTAEIRACYTVGVDDNSAEGPEFYRWLAEHDREVKAEAWDEGWDEGVLWPDGKLQNPYREVSK